MKRAIIPVLALTLALSCGKKESRADATLAESKDVEAAPVVPKHDDPGPRLGRKTGALAPVARPAGDASVDRIQRVGDVTIAVVPLWMDSLPQNVDRVSFVVEAGETYGSAFGWSGTGVTDDKLSLLGVIVRFQGDVPKNFKLRWHEVASNSWRARPAAGTTAEISVGVPAKLATVKGLDTEFWNSAARWFETHPGRAASHSGFYGYARNRATFIAGGIKAQKPGPDGWRRGSDVHQMMELYSGMTSVNEALQSDRGLRVRAEDPGERTLDIDSVKRLELANHPWDRMIAELGAQPRIEPLAAYVPADMAYLHFGDLRTFVKLVGDLDDWVSPVAQWLEERGGASHFMSRYEEQLVLERTGLAEKLGHVAASGVAVLTSDPYLREGTDVSLMFKVESKAALVGALGAFEASSRALHPDMTTSTSKVGGVTVQRLHTPDGAVNQYRAEYGDVLVLSNSLGAIEHLIATHAGKVPKLAAEGDFKYLRAVYPWDPKAEDGFIFLSDAFVGRAVSPEVKILEARRMDAQADLFALNYAALLRGWVDGRTTSSGQELVDAGYILPGELSHVSGEPIDWSAARGARSAWGDASQITPIRDLQLGKVSSREVEAYDRFRQTYESYWRSYLDPIAARISRSEDGKRLGIDARMLPLINASEYDDLIREVGIQKVIGPASAPGMQWIFAIGKDARIRRELDGMARGFIPGTDMGIDWLGDWVSVGVSDRSGLWDMAVKTQIIPTLEESDEDIWSGLEQLSTFPMYAQAHIANKVGFAAVLTGLKGYVSDAAPGMVSWGQTEPYRDIPIVTIGEGAQAGGQFGGIAIHYATVDDVFVLALDRPTLLTQIDRLLTDGGAKAPTGPPSGATDQDAQASMDVEMNASGWLSKTLMGIAEQGLLGEHGRVMEGYEVLWRGFGQRKLEPSDVRALGVAYMGFEPRSPHGGTFAIVDGFPTHSIYGDAVRPIMPEVPVKGSPVTRVLQELQKLSMSLEFDGEGDHRGLHSTVSWLWR